MAECFAGGHLRFLDGEWRDDNGDVVEIEPVVYAYWQSYKEDSSDNRTLGWRCSRCRRYRFHNGAMRRKYKRCPNCGARMKASQDAADVATQSARARFAKEVNDMRAYILYDPPAFAHPEDMKKILNYLQLRGSLNLTSADVEDYYIEFSGERYSASWIGVGILTLEEFAEWLAEQDI